MQVSFGSVAEGAGALQNHIIEIDPSSGKPFRDRFDPVEMTSVSIQCFPLYSVLLAANQTRVDFFSLDIEGHELRVLKTIPWHKVDIRVI